MPVGRVVVDLLHMRQHVAKEISVFKVDQYRQRQTPIVLFYPFRPVF